MKRKYVHRLWFPIALVLGLLSACTAPAGAPTPVQATPTIPAGSYTLDISGVEVRAGERITITFTGTTTLPEGACLITQLTADGADVEWWPQGHCAPIGPTWEIGVTLPGPLDDEAHYRLHAWWDGDPAGVTDVFYFDLAPPPGP